MSAPARHLVIFVRTPALGQVKRRLALDIGAVAACAFYRRVLARVVRRFMADARWRTWLAVTPDRDADAAFWPKGVETLAQGRGDIGQRMARIMCALPPGDAVIVGTDVPAIAPAPVWRAFVALGENDAVFGPAADGGYWLVGLRRRPRIADVFGGVRWSSRHTLADTLAGIEGRLRYTLIDTLADVDDGAAYAAWRSSLDRFARDAGSQ